MFGVSATMEFLKLAESYDRMSPTQLSLLCHIILTNYPELISVAYNVEQINELKLRYSVNIIKTDRAKRFLNFRHFSSIESFFYPLYQFFMIFYRSKNISGRVEFFNTCTLKDSGNNLFSVSPCCRAQYLTRSKQLQT